MAPELDPVHELYGYTLSHPSPVFLHQHVVDAHAAQTASEESKPIATIFALIGLYLHIEKSFTGRQVQMAHMQMARRKRAWPRLQIPEQRGAVSAADVLAVPPGPERDAAIHGWCVAVWASWKERHIEIAELARKELGID
jgi:hypothetical protein